MLFKQRIFFNHWFFLFFLLPHCGLEIGEKAPSIPKYEFTLSRNYCSKLDYKKEFSAYFFEDQKENEETHGKRIQKSFQCIISKVRQGKDLIVQEHLGKQEVSTLFDQDFIKVENFKSIIDHIMDPDFFDKYIFIKNAMVYLIDKKRKDQPIYAHKICASEIKPYVISKQEVEEFAKFLKDLSLFFQKIEEKSYDLFFGFFEKEQESELILKSNWKNLDLVKQDFIPFLSSYLEEEYTDFSQFLNDNNSKEKISEALASMIPFPPSSSELVTVQNIKYLILNIYIMKTIFFVYDTNKDKLLQIEELRALSCLIHPLLSVMISSKLKGGVIASYLSPEDVLSYILRNQELPQLWNPRYFIHKIFRLLGQNDYEPLSYIEISKLISSLFFVFFSSLE